MPPFAWEYKFVKIVTKQCLRDAALDVDKMVQEELAEHAKRQAKEEGRRLVGEPRVLTIPVRPVTDRERAGYFGLWPHETMRGWVPCNDKRATAVEYQLRWSHCV